MRWIIIHVSLHSNDEHVLHVEELEGHDGYLAKTKHMGGVKHTSIIITQLITCSSSASTPSFMFAATSTYLHAMSSMATTLVLLDVTASIHQQVASVQEWKATEKYDDKFRDELMHADGTRFMHVM